MDEIDQVPADLRDDGKTLSGSKPAEILIPIVPQLRPVATLQIAPDLLEQMTPGTTTGGELHGSYAGIFSGVIVPTCEFMWSVLLFVRFGQVVGQAGVFITLALLLLSATTVLVTLFSIAGIASNSLPHGRVYHILETSLGRGVGGSIALTYYLGLMALVGAEIVGSTQALMVTMQSLGEESDSFNFVFTGSMYWDQVLLSVFTLLICALLACTTWVRQRVAQVFLLILVASFAFMIAGLLKEAIVPRTESVFEITDMSTFYDNLWPDDSFDFSETVSYMFPCFLGMFVGVNNSKELKSPTQSIAKGGIVSIATSLFLYNILAILFGSAVNRQTLLRNNLIGPQLAWPWSWVTLPGVYVVGLGSAMQCLLLASSVLQSLSAENILPYFSHRLRLPKEYGTVPIPAVFFTFVLTLTLAFIPDLEVVAKLATMCFLLCYGSVNLACFLLTAFKSPDYRPKYQSHWSIYAIGCCLCLFLMFQIQWYTSLVAVVAVISFAYLIQTQSTTVSWGQGFQGLIVHLMLSYLLSAESSGQHRSRSTFLDISSDDRLEVHDVASSDATISPNWRPQVVTFVGLTNTGALKAPRLLSFISQLKTRSALCILAAVIPRESLPVVEISGEQHQIIEELLDYHKMEIKRAMKQQSMEGFVKVFTAPTVRVGQRLLLSTMGIGDLTPNILIVTWPQNVQDSSRRHKIICELQDLWQMTTRLGLSYMIVKGANLFPTNDSRMRRSIDVWWIVHDGQLLLLIAYLLKQNQVWAACPIRLFCLCHIDDNLSAVESDLVLYLTILRIRVDKIQVVPIQLFEGSTRNNGRGSASKFRHDEMAFKLTQELEEDVNSCPHSSDHSDTDQEETFEEEINFVPRAISPSPAPASLSASRLQERVLFVNAVVIKQLRTAIQKFSKESDLMIFNLPAPTRKDQQFSFGRAVTGMYLELVETLTEGIARSVLVYSGLASRDDTPADSTS